MKILFAAMALLAVIYFMSAFMQRTDRINGASQTAALRSAKSVKRYMTDQQQHLFETSFWALNTIKSKEGPDAFLATVDGKTPDEIIEIAKQEVSARIAAGDPDFKKYGSWEDFVNDKTGEDKKKPAQPLRNSSRTGRPE